MTAADLLSRMKILANELRIASGGADESRCLTALDMAQDYFEDVAASMPKVGQRTTTCTTSANTETTAWPTGLLRVDSVWYVDPATSRPAWELRNIYDTGGHQPQSPFPYNLSLSSGTGAPREYFSDEQTFYWRPLPDATHTLRVYGLIARTALTSRSVTFGWQDSVSLPLTAFAVQLVRLGVDDRTDELQALAEQMFTPVLRRMRKSVRQGPMSKHYTQVHTT